MKLIIPMSEENLESSVCSSFGRAPYFLYYDTDTKENRFIVNTAADKPGGVGIAAAQLILDNGADALIAPRLGENAGKILSSGNVAIYICIEGTALENIEALSEGKLTQLSEFHPGFHGHAE